MRPTPLRLVLAAALLASSTTQAASSSFNADAEGWTAEGNGNATVDWADGAISMLDVTEGWAYLQAPDSYRAPVAAGGSFSFDLRHEATGTQPRAYGVRVALTSGSTTLIAEAAKPTADWVRYDFALAPSAGWRSFSDLQQRYEDTAPEATLETLTTVLGALTGVYIAADYTDANAFNGLGIDRTFIDNVQLLAAPVPEAEPWAMLAAGLAALGWLAKRRGA